MSSSEEHDDPADNEVTDAEEETVPPPPPSPPKDASEEEDSDSSSDEETHAKSKPKHSAAKSKPKAKVAAKTTKASTKQTATKASGKKSAGAKQPAPVKSKPPMSMRTKSKSTSGHGKPNQKSIHGKSVRKLKCSEAKSKGAKAAKSKPAHRSGEQQEKSNRRTTTAPASVKQTPEDLIKAILSDLKTKSKLDQSPSSLGSSSAGSDYSHVDDSAKSKPKVKAPSKKTNKAAKSSCKSSATAAKGKKPAPKGKESSKGGASEELSPSSGSRDKLADAAKTIKQLKMDPKTAEALEKYLPDLVNALQKQGEAKAAAAGAADQFTNDDMEDLNDELTDLNTSISTLRHSYGSIVRSLANMQKRRAKKATLAPVTGAQAGGAEGGANAEPGAVAPVAALTIEDICARVSTNYDTKFSMERFLDGNSRDALFQELFQEVAEINAAMAQFKTFFNGEGYFQMAAYLAQDEFKLTRAKYTDCLKVIKDLSKSVTAILKAYNTDLLDMFRITSQAS